MAAVAPGPSAVAGRYVVIQASRQGDVPVRVAYDTQLARRVALVSIGGEGEATRDQAQRLAQLADPHVAALYDVGADAGHAFAAIELLEGPTLEAWLDSERPRWRRVVDVLAQVGRGLRAARAAGAVHPALDAGSVHVDADGRARVTGFLAPIAGAPAAGADYRRLVARALAGRRAPAWLEAAWRAPGAEAQDGVDATLAALEADPTGRRLVAAVVAALLVAGLSAGGWRVARLRSARAACRAEGGAVDAAWSPPRRQAVRAAMRAEAMPFAEERAERTVASLDAYAGAWRAAQTASCEATRVTREQPEALHEGRALCLRTDLQELDAVAEMLASDDHAAHVNGQSLARLPPPSICTAKLAGTVARPPTDPAARALSDRARLSIARAAVWSQAGRVRQSLDELAQARDLAAAAHDLAAAADALRFTAYELSSDGKSDEAIDALEKAIALAEEAGDDHAVGICAAQLAFELGESKRALEGGTRWLEVARAKLARVGEDPSLEQHVVFTAAELASLEPEGAAREYALWGEVAAKTRAVYGDGTYVCPVLANRGQAAWRMLDPAASLAATRASIACEEEVNGAHSARLDGRYTHVARALAALGRADEALAAARHATEARRAIAPDSPLVARSLAAQAEALLGLGRPAEAELAAREALPYAEKRPADLPFALTELGLARLAQGDAAGAASACERAVSALDERDPPSPATVYDFDPLRCAAEAEAALGRLDLAREHATRSARLVRRPAAGDLERSRALAAKLGEP